MRTIITFLLGALLFPALCFGAYKAEEMCFIPWGDGRNQLKIGEPHYEYDIVDTLGTIDSALWESGGPSNIFVDKYENIYVSSYEYYFQCLDDGLHVIKWARE